MAKHEIVVISDADVRVPENFLTNLVQPLREKKIGLVNCFYKFANPKNVAMRWEAMAVNADFWSQVLQSKMLKPIDFALGAVMATHREILKEIGGFAALVDFLADDYQLGNRIAKTGKEIALSPVVVECRERPMNFKEVWAHQLRWARTIRVCQPIPFFFSILSNATLWPVLLFLWLVITGVSLKLAILPILIFLSARIFIALHLQEKLTQALEHYAWFWLVPVKDLLGVAIWALAFIGNEVQWRGVKYKVLKGGKLRVAE
jgi:ceramide glucosyltransferase